MAMERTATQDDLLSKHYDEFCRIAGRVLKGDAARLQLEAKDLAHEAAVRLTAFQHIDFKSRTHFLSFAARLMRNVLIDEIRKRKATKRQMSGDHRAVWSADTGVHDFETLHHAVRKLATRAPHQALLVEQRCYAGLTIEEIAEVNCVSVRTVKRQWRATCAWLHTEIVG